MIKLRLDFALNSGAKVLLQTGPAPIEVCYNISIIWCHYVYKMRTFIILSNVGPPRTIVRTNRK